MRYEKALIHDENNISIFQTSQPRLVHTKIHLIMLSISFSGALILALSFAENPKAIKNIFAQKRSSFHEEKEIMASQRNQ